MNDIYLKVANSALGKSFLEALSLPTPPELYRSPDSCLSNPTGRVLVGAVKNNRCYGNILKALSKESIKLFTPQFSATNKDKFAAPIQKNGISNVSLQKLSSKTAPKYQTVVFDASGMQSPSELTCLYEFFKPIVRGIKDSGKIVVLGDYPIDTNSAASAACAESLEGFVKSLAKEIGYKGATCNLLQVEKATDKSICAPLYYLLSEKSAFVTGQTLVLSQQPANRKKLDWQSPLDGKLALVTGAAQGIGETTARVLARDGAEVICLDIPANEKPTKRLADQIGGHPMSVDLSDKEAPEAVSTQIASQLGPIDIVVHNAGITRDKTLGKMPPHFWQQVLNINLEKIISINQTLSEKQLLNNYSRIVCISSISGIAGNFGQTNYACSKSGVTGYVKALSSKIENSGTINAIAPGFIETQMTKKIPFMTREIGRRTSSLGQGGLTLDVAEAVSFFCHPASQGLNGNVLRVCGQSLLGK